MNLWKRVRVCLRHRRYLRRVGCSIRRSHALYLQASRQMVHDQFLEELTQQRNEGYVWRAPLTGKSRRCRVITHNPMRPWVAFWMGPTIQRRWTWMRRVA